MKRFIFALLLFIGVKNADAARFIEPCTLHLTIQDGNIGENIIQDVLIDNKSVFPKQSSFFEAKKVKILLPEGMHTLIWKVRKKDFGKGYYEYENFEKQFEVERYDLMFYINIQGKDAQLLSPGRP